MREVHDPVDRERTVERHTVEHDPTQTVDRTDRWRLPWNIRRLSRVIAYAARKLRFQGGAAVHFDPWHYLWALRVHDLGQG